MPAGQILRTLTRAKAEEDNNTKFLLKRKTWKKQLWSDWPITFLLSELCQGHISECLSIQFNFICIAPNHNILYLKALYIEGHLNIIFLEKPNSSHNEQHFGDCGEKNSLNNWKKPREPDSMWATSQGGNHGGGEERWEEKRGEKRERDQFGVQHLAQGHLGKSGIEPPLPQALCSVPSQQVHRNRHQTQFCSSHLVIFWERMLQRLISSICAEWCSVKVLGQ